MTKDTMTTEPASRLPSSIVVPRLVEAATKLLADQGPSHIKARSVAEAAGLSTTALYYHVGGIPELLNAVVIQGFAQLDAAFARLSSTADPVSDLMAMAVACRGFAQKNAHLYDLMFGLSTRGSYRQLKFTSKGARSEAFVAAYQHSVEASTRLAASQRIQAGHDPELIAAQLWSAAHGFITLELTDHFDRYADPLTEILLALTVNVMVGLGDNHTRARASGAAGIQRYLSSDGASMTASHQQPGDTTKADAKSASS
jgi:AcrR family transcriptional regulator